MKNQIKSRDWEVLSAYLDGQLSSREQTRLETRLNKDPDLQSALEDLRQMRNVLRNLPKIRVPRNFILTPEMVGLKRDTVRFFPVLRLASVLAMILLAFVFIGDYLTISTPSTVQPSAPSMMEMEVTNDVYSPPQSAEEATVMKEEAEESLGGLAYEAPAMEALTDEIEGEARAPVMKASEPTPTVLATSSAMVMPYPAVDEADSVQDSSLVGKINRNTLFRVLEIGLAIIAISAGIAAFVLRRGSLG
jgi:anti-sigma factor RsiW